MVSARLHSIVILNAPRHSPLPRSLPLFPLFFPWQHPGLLHSPSLFIPASPLSRALPTFRPRTARGIVLAFGGGTSNYAARVRDPGNPSVSPLLFLSSFPHPPSSPLSQPSLGHCFSRPRARLCLPTFPSSPNLPPALFTSCLPPQQSKQIIPT